MSFARALAKTLGHEGGFSNHPSDSGGATKWGITERTARACGYTGPMKDLPPEKAEEIYHLVFWQQPGFGAVAVISELVAHELFDSGVNCRPDRACVWLQRSLNVLNGRGRLYSDILVDGLVGRVTTAALRDYLARRGTEGERVLLRMLNSLQGEFYVGLAESREKDEDFVYGWFRNRVVML
jgi:lysozyme family protein